ncbi:hypothetical protein PG994_003329 [Apiospora phragmitis]|uniref:Uncharacterized protein n=1 Tax=Apiospora phragmitis TaxID=2905665 RepID=A0ABR1VZ04_9PEZI
MLTNTTTTITITTTTATVIHTTTSGHPWGRQTKEPPASPCGCNGCRSWGSSLVCGRCADAGCSPVGPAGRVVAGAVGLVDQSVIDADAAAADPAAAGKKEDAKIKKLAAAIGRAVAIANASGFSGVTGGGDLATPSGRRRRHSSVA